MSLLANSNAIESGGYNIDRSLRFRSSASAYLSRTPASAGNRKTWTWSGWVKRGTLGASNRIFAADDGSASTDQDYNTLFFTSADKIQFSGGLTNFRITTSVYRDPSAWYHIVFVTDTTQATAGNRFKLYVNGVEVTAFDTSNNPAQNTDLAVNAAIGHYHGAIATPVVNYFDGYLAEVNFIDGQALTPSSFGQTDFITGVWVPKKYTGTYGTNGFYLNFSDNTSATTLAYDKSGNGNNWTANNISTTAGATYDSMTDVPTLTSATAANYSVLNPISNLSTSGTITNGNLSVVTASSGDQSIPATIFVSSGKWYMEFTCTKVGSGGSSVGLIPTIYAAATQLGNTTDSWVYRSSGSKRTNGSDSSYGASWTTNDIIGIALDMDAGTLAFYKNGTSQGTAFTGISGTFTFAWSDTSGADTTSANANFGQRPFSYTPPTGFKALNTFNLPDPTIKKPNQYMDATLYTGNGTSQSIVNAGGFAPDFLIQKSRSSATDNIVYDSLRGSNYLVTNSTAAEVASGVIALTSNGFNVGSGTAVNVNAATYVGWQWKESATAGFDIVTYTGTSAASATISHNLGVAPKMIIVKNRSTTTDWPVYHASLGNANKLKLNLTDAVAVTGDWNNTSPTSTVFSVAAGSSVFSNGNNFVAYLFAEIAGFSKAFSYTGNGSADGPMVWCGFQPRFILQKRTDSTGDWRMIDTARGTYNVIGPELQANQSAAEYTGNNFDVLSNGFKLRSTGAPVNASGGTYIGMAFASNPFKYSNAF